MFLITPFSKTVNHHTHICVLCFGSAPQAILASHFSKSWMSAEPVSPLPPLALHSRNSTLRGNCENSNSLPFFPSWAGAVLELSSVLGAAERVTRKVLLWDKEKTSQEAKELWFLISQLKTFRKLNYFLKISFKYLIIKLPIILLQLLNPLHLLIMLLDRKGRWEPNLTWLDDSRSVLGPGHTNLLSAQCPSSIRIYCMMLFLNTYTYKIYTALYKLKFPKVKGV